MFSIRCHRSATCIACGRAFAAAWPYPPPPRGRRLRSWDAQRAKLGQSRLTIRQQDDYPARFHVADDAGVSVIALPGPVIDTDGPGSVDWRTAAASDHAQKRVFAHWQHQPSCEAGCRSTAERQTKVMDDESSLAVRT